MGEKLNWRPTPAGPVPGDFTGGSQPTSTSGGQGVAPQKFPAPPAPPVPPAKAPKGSSLVDAPGRRPTPDRGTAATPGSWPKQK